MLKRFFQQKLVLGGFFGTIAAVVIFALAFMGSTVDPAPKNLPVAVVMQDTGADVPGQGSMNFGNTIQKQLQQNKQSTVAWIFLNSKKQALQGLDDKKYYAAIVFPETMTKQTLSLTAPNGQQAEIQVFLNQGMNYTAAAASGQIIDKMMDGINNSIRDSLLSQLEQRKATLTPAQVKLLAAPLAAKTELVHPVPARTGNGNLPAMLTQILWMSTFISSMLLFAAMKKVTHRITLGSVTTQLLAGAVFVAAIAGAVLFMADSVLDVSIPNAETAFMLLLFFGFMFFLLQNAVLNWIGIAGAPLFILLFFFSSPVLTLAPEFLPEATRNWLSSWVPFTYSVEAFRSSFFFDGYGAGAYQQTMSIIGLVSLVVMALAVFKPHAKQTESSLSQ